MSGEIKEECRMISLVQANNYLALQLHLILTKEERNVFFSPFSISMAMAMLFRGTKEDTSEEMRKVLGFQSANIANDEVHNSFGNMLSILSENQDYYTLAIANSLVSHKDFQLLPEFKNDLQKIYRALILEVDFLRDSVGAVKQINDWVKKSTNSLIPKVVDSLDPSTVMILLNAVYFKGTWVHQFDPENTQPGSFYNNGNKENVKEVPMMFHTKEYLFVEKDTYKALELPYKGKDIAMLILLPKELNGLADLEKNMGNDFINKIQKDMHRTEVEVTLPKLHLEYSKELKTVFQELGLKKIFDCEANFQGLSESFELKVSEILHKALLDVNEEGSEAAAVTAVCVNYCARYITEFKANHPFLLVIYEKNNEMILFMGHVEEL